MQRSKRDQTAKESMLCWMMMMLEDEESEEEAEEDCGDEGESGASDDEPISSPSASTGPKVILQPVCVCVVKSKMKLCRRTSTDGNWVREAEVVGGGGSGGAARLLAELESRGGDERWPEERRRLERMIRGLLNRLSEATLAAAGKELGGLWSSRSRGAVKDELRRFLLALPLRRPRRPAVSPLHLRRPPRPSSLATLLGTLRSPSGRNRSQSPTTPRSASLRPKGASQPRLLHRSALLLQKSGSFHFCLQCL